MILFAVGRDAEKGDAHAVRTSIIARTCLTRGMEVSFLCTDQDVSAYLKAKGFSYVHETHDRRILKDTASQKPSFLVWDTGTPLKPGEVEYLHRHAIPVLEFDVSDGKSHADEVVNGFESRLRSATGREYRLVGPDYVVVDRNFCSAREWRRASSVLQNALGLFICLGGSDPSQLLEPTLEALTDIPSCRTIQIRAVAEFDRKDVKEIQKKFSAFRNIQIHASADAVLLAQLMRFSFLGIVSFGATLAGALAAELPVLMINPTEAHEEQATRLVRGTFAGVGKTLGCLPHIDWDRVRRELAALLDRRREIERMQVAATGLVDRQGAQRIARYLFNSVTAGRAANGGLVAISAK